MPIRNPHHRESAELIRLLALETVPPVTTERWSPRRKAQIVDAVGAGLLTEEEVCRLYRMNADELSNWRRSLSQSGRQGLRVTKLRRPRRANPLEPSPHYLTALSQEQVPHG